MYSIDDSHSLHYENRHDTNVEESPQRPYSQSTKPCTRKKIQLTSPISPNDDETVGTMMTTGTLHRRTNSTTTFTVNSLKQIFEFEPKQRNLEFGLSPTIEVIPQTIRNVRHRENNDDESLISPLADDDNTTCFNFEDTWPEPVVAKRIKFPPEPTGTYMPKSAIFKEEVDGGHSNCSLEGWVRICSLLIRINHVLNFFPLLDCF